MTRNNLPAAAASGLLFPRTIDDLFQTFWGENRPGQMAWAPTVDVEETDAAYHFHVEIPGIDAKDIDLTVTPDGLTLKGEKKVERAGDAGKRHIVERSYGAFSRSFTFPTPVSTDEVVAEAKQGVLHITVQKSERNQTRRVEIRSES